jgi:hypothetical protein
VQNGPKTHTKPTFEFTYYYTTDHVLPPKTNKKRQITQSNYCMHNNFPFVSALLDVYLFEACLENGEFGYRDLSR